MTASAEASIRSIISTYAQASTTKDESQWSSTWSEGGIWELMGNAPEGREAVVEYWKSLMGNIAFVYQLAGEGSIEIDSDGQRGTGRVPTIEFVKFGDGPGTLMLGTYHDVYVLENGRWCFGERRMKVNYMGPPDMSGPVA